MGMWVVRARSKVKVVIDLRIELELLKILRAPVGPHGHVDGEGMAQGEGGD